MPLPGGLVAVESAELAQLRAAAAAAPQALAEAAALAAVRTALTGYLARKGAITRAEVTSVLALTNAPTT